MQSVHDLQKKLPVEKVLMADLIAWHSLASQFAFKTTTVHLKGGVLSRVKGRGMEFEDVRPYQFQDDSRHIDWKVTARTSKPHTKCFIEERETSSHLLVDLRANMHFATFGVFKSVMASHIAAFLSWISKHQGEKLGLSILTHELKHIPSNKVQHQQMVFLKSLENIHNRNVTEPQKIALNNSTLLGTLKLISSQTKLFVVTDMQGALEFFSEFKGAQVLGKLHLVVIFDALEARLPKGNFGALQSGKIVDVNQSLQKRIEYQAAYDLKRSQIEALCLKYKIMLSLIRTDETFVPKLIQDFHLVKQRR